MHISKLLSGFYILSQIVAMSAIKENILNLL